MVERLVESAQCKATLCGEAHVNHIMHIVFTHKNISHSSTLPFAPKGKGPSSSQSKGDILPGYEHKHFKIIYINLPALNQPHVRLWGTLLGFGDFFRILVFEKRSYKGYVTFLVYQRPLPGTNTWKWRRPNEYCLS